jgi:hypothetical protein
MVGDTNLVSPKLYWRCHNHWFSLWRVWARADCFKASPETFNCQFLLCCFDNYNGSQHRQCQPIYGTSIHCAGNFNWSSKLVAWMWSRAHIHRILWHPWCLAESQDDFVPFLLKLGHDKLSKCMCKITCCGHRGHKRWLKQIVHFKDWPVVQMHVLLNIRYTHECI